MTWNCANCCHSWFRKMCCVMIIYWKFVYDKSILYIAQSQIHQRPHKYDANLSFILILKHRGCMNQFYHALIHTGQQHLAELLSDSANIRDPTIPKRPRRMGDDTAQNVREHVKYVC